MFDKEKISNLKFLYLSKESSIANKIDSLLKEGESLKSELEELDKVNEFFQNFINLKTQKTREFVEQIVNRGLKFVFQDNIRIEIVSNLKNNRVVYDVLIVDESSKISGGRESHGGGVLAVVAFLFKFLANYLTKKVPFLVEDESLADVSSHFQERLSNFISELCVEFNYDLCLVSHQDKLDRYGDLIYVLAKAGNKTVIEEVKKGDLKL